MQLPKSIISAINQLGETFEPYFGQLSLFVVLSLSVYLSYETHLNFRTLAKGVPISLLGYLLPQGYLSDLSLFQACKWILWLAASLWLAVPFLGFCSRRTLRILITLSTWTTYASYVSVASIYWENLPFYLHKFVLPSWLLLIYALWYHFYKQEIINALKLGVFWQTALYPRWTYALSVYVMALYYTFAGISKLRSTLTWGNGLSLQLWTYLYGDRTSPFAKFILYDRTYASLFQGGVMILECLTFLSIFNTRLRMLIGLCLLFFHLAVDMTFHINFSPNMVLLVIFFMPIFALSVHYNNKP